MESIHLCRVNLFLSFLLLCLPFLSSTLSTFPSLFGVSSAAAVCAVCLLSCTMGLKTSRSDACSTGALLLAQGAWSCSNGAQHFLGTGGAVLQWAVLGNSVLCREAMLLGRIMEEEEAGKKTRPKGGEAGNLRNNLSLSLLPASLSLSLFLVYCTLMFCPSFPPLSPCHAACPAFPCY